MKHARVRGWRGSLLGFTLAFALVVVSAFVLFRGNTAVNLRLVRLSIGLSSGAVLVAVLSLLFPRR